MRNLFGNAETLQRVVAAGVIAATGLAIAQRWFPGAIEGSLVILWTIGVLAWWHRRALFPGTNKFTAEAQDAFTFIGWFVIATIVGGSLALWLLF
jgi:hypothetical protein